MVHPTDVSSPSADNRLPYPVVAIGASAGGLPALSTLLGALPAALKAALVVITHAAPDVKSQLATILASLSRLPVKELTDREPATPGVVHVLPSGHDLIIENGQLLLMPRENAVVHRPIDRFLVSLARDQGPSAVAVILSGAGSDGSRGIRDVHAAGGLVIVQDLSSAEHDGMPVSAVQTGLADVVLPIEAMGPYLVATLPAIEQESVAPADTGYVPETDRDHPAGAYRPRFFRLQVEHPHAPGAQAQAAFAKGHPGGISGISGTRHR